MRTRLRNCEVPWAISPTGSGITLIHEETSIEPKCRVVLGAGRLNSDGFTDLRRIELVFELAFFSRTTPHGDSQSPSDYGFDIIDDYKGDINSYIEWRHELWTKTGICPNSGFYIAESSVWLESIQESYRKNYDHYLLDGRDGHVELLASKYHWAEWTLEENNRDWSEIWPLETAVDRSKNSG